jgi:hypothetical protein
MSVLSLQEAVERTGTSKVDIWRAAFPAQPSSSGCSYRNRRASSQMCATTGPRLPGCVDEGPFARSFRLQICRHPPGAHAR